jgi:hypothetical protein
MLQLCVFESEFETAGLSESRTSMVEFGISRQLTLFCHWGPSQQDSEKLSGARVQSFSVGPGASLLGLGTLLYPTLKKDSI